MNRIAADELSIRRYRAVLSCWQIRCVALVSTFLVIGCLDQPAMAAQTTKRTDVFTEDVSRFQQLLVSPLPERRVEAVQGLSHLKHWPAETALLPLLNDPAPNVRREAVLALGRLGTAPSIPHLIRLLDDPWWELRQNAWLALGRMTAQDFAADAKTWQQWWDSNTVAEKEQALVAALTSAPPETSTVARRERLRAWRHFASPGAEDALLGYLATGQKPPLQNDERTFIMETLERIGTARSVAVLSRERLPAAAWALGRIGGAEAETALLNFPKNLPVWLNLDRLHSTNVARFIPELVGSFGLVTYRSQPDDVQAELPQPIQRVAANLIRRSGEAPRLIELVLRELEATMNPPVSSASPPPEIPAHWAPMLEQMRHELKPGFVRSDGRTTSQPLTALSHVAEDPALAARLVPLLRHPALVPRIYVALTLARLRAPEALPAILELVEEGYAFSDATALASGKHFDKSQHVRWRGFLCMALGRLGTDPARRALETFATDAQRARDIRYSAVVGLGFIGSPKSLAALERVASEDVIWMVRDTARQIAAEIRLASAVEPTTASVNEPRTGIE